MVQTGSKPPWYKLDLNQSHIQNSSQNMASNCVIFSTWWLHDIPETLRSINLKSTVYSLVDTVYYIYMGVPGGS